MNGANSADLLHVSLGLQKNRIRPTPPPRLLPSLLSGSRDQNVCSSGILIRNSFRPFSFESSHLHDCPSEASVLIISSVASCAASIGCGVIAHHPVSCVQRCVQCVASVHAVRVMCSECGGGALQVYSMSDRVSQ